MGLADIFSKGIVLHNSTVGGTAEWFGYLPSGGQNMISLVCIVKMAHATDLTCTVETADDADGGSAESLAKDIPLFKGTSGSLMELQDDADSFTEEAASGTYIYVFEVPPTLVPDDKYLGVEVATGDSGNSADTVTVIAFEDTIRKAS